MSNNSMAHSRITLLLINLLINLCSYVQGSASKDEFHESTGATMPGAEECDGTIAVMKLYQPALIHRMSPPVDAVNKAYLVFCIQ